MKTTGDLRVAFLAAYPPDNCLLCSKTPQMAVNVPCVKDSKA